MMKRLWFVALLLATALAVVGTGAVQGQRQIGVPLIDYAPDKPGVPMTVTDAIPRVYVRFDDGRKGADPNNPVKSQVAAFLRRGIPVTVSLNADNIGGVNYWSWDDVRTLQRFARGHGTELHIAQHTNGNFQTPFLMTHDQIVAELDPTEIINETGYRPRALVIPGDTARREFFRRNHDYMVDVADSLGLWWTDMNGTAPDSLSFVFNEPSFINFDNYAAQPSNTYPATRGLLRPSMGVQRWELVSETLDLGNYMVERVENASIATFEPTVGQVTGGLIGYGEKFQTGVEPPTVGGWTITGNGGNATASGLYRKTWASFYSGALAVNSGFAVVFHDSAGAFSGDPFTGITNAEYLAGAASPEHVAWTLAMLERRGHIKLVGIEEWAQWVTGEFSPNTDLINNARCAIPQFDIGDTLGATSEYAYIRGLGSHGVYNTNQAATIHQINNLPVEQTGNVAKYVRHTGASSADSPYYAIGDSVTGTRGRKGGILMRADGSQPTLLNLVFGNLKPGGAYRFSIDVRGNSGVNPVVKEMHFGYKFKSFKLNDTAEAGFSEAYRDTMISWKWRDADITLNVPAFNDAKWNTLPIPFWLPEWPLGETVAGASYGSVSEAAPSATQLFVPYSDGNNEGLLGRGSWAWSLQLDAQGVVRLSNPRFVYLGQWQ